MIPLLPRCKVSSFYECSLAVQPGLCQALSDIPKTGFLVMQLICFYMLKMVLSNEIKAERWPVIFESLNLTPSVFSGFTE